MTADHPTEQMPSVRLNELTVACFRNLEIDRLPLDGGRTVVLGGNGAGKTSLLEAVVVLGNLRSFRTRNPRRMVRHGEDAYRLAGSVSGSRGGQLELVCEVGPPHLRTPSINGRPAEVGEYLQVLPCFALTGADRDLVLGPPHERRALLDRFLFLLAPAHLEDLRTYQRALRQRNAALAHGASDDEVAAWEGPLAAAAGRVVVGRRRGTSMLAEQFSAVYADLAGPSSPAVGLDLRHEAWLPPDIPADTVEVLYRQRYNETRARDRQTGFTLDGPHRHDVSLRSEGREARYLLSSGQAKVVAASLRLATLARVERERRERYPVIVDDVDAELDRDALRRLLGSLGDERQVLLSSTSEHVAEIAGGGTQRIWIDNGTCVPRETSLNG